MDLRQGYHQLTLDPGIRHVATFSTSGGNYRPKRLAFRAKYSQDVFDEAMLRAFKDIPHCLNRRDDILLGGSAEAEHKEVLKTVLQRARDHGVTFNKEKCQLGKEQIEFFGHVFTNDGLKPSPHKVKAIRECSPPERKAGYLNNYISNYAAIAAPLYQLPGKTQNSNGRKKKKNHSGRYKTASQTTRQWYSLTHPDL